MCVYVCMCVCVYIYIYGRVPFNVSIGVARQRSKFPYPWGAKFPYPLCHKVSIPLPGQCFHTFTLPFFWLSSTRHDSLASNADPLRRRIGCVSEPPETRQKTMSLPFPGV